MAKTKKTKEYLKYEARFNYNKKLGNIYKGERKYRPAAFNRKIAETGLTGIQLARTQERYTKKQLTRLEKDYDKKLKKHLKPGEAEVIEDSYWANSLFKKGTDLDNLTAEDFEEYNTVRYHRTLGGILKDKRVVHLLITDRLIEGDNRVKVLADYGYNE